MSQADAAPTVNHEDLKAKWEAICNLIGIQTYRFPLRFGRQWDWGNCIVEAEDGWDVVDVYRGDELSSVHYMERTDLLFHLAESMTWALAGWEEKETRPNYAKLRQRFFPRYDYKDRIRAIQRRLMTQISRDWGLRLKKNHAQGSRS